MKHWQPTALALAAALAFPGAAMAQASAADVAKEIEALKSRIADLEKKLGEAAATKPQWGMTPEQAAEFNRISVKTESLEDQRDALGFKGLQVNGVIDLPIVWNQNRRTFGPQFLVDTGTDPYSYDSSYFGMAIFDFLKETESGTLWRLTLAPQRGAGAVAMGSIVHEASVSVPLTSDKVRLLAGQIPDWSGYEFLPAHLNKLITHNLLFDFTLPTTYTGVGLELGLDKWVFKSVVGTMNTSRKNPKNRYPMIAYRGDYARGEFLGWGFAGVHGKAVNFNDAVLDANGDFLYYNDSILNLLEADVWYTRGDISLNGQISFGTQKGASITPDPVTGALRNSQWWGLSGLAGYKLSPRLEAIGRLDYLNNSKNGGGLLGYTVADARNGIGPDPAGDPERGASRVALSLGLNYLFNENTMLKAEYRLDRASAPVFEDLGGGGFRKSNNVIATQIVVFW
jgi:hypothetical protein